MLAVAALVAAIGLAWRDRSAQEVALALACVAIIATLTFPFFRDRKTEARTHSEGEFRGMPPARRGSSFATRMSALAVGVGLLGFYSMELVVGGHSTAGSLLLLLAIVGLPVVGVLAVLDVRRARPQAGHRQRR